MRIHPVKLDESFWVLRDQVIDIFISDWQLFCGVQDCCHQSDAYPKIFENYWGKRINESRKVVEMLDRFKDDDLNNLAEILTREDIISLANGTNVPSTLARLFKRSPLKLMRLMRAYLR